MQLADFDFVLPTHLIAQQAIKKRTNSRLLIGQNPIIDTQFGQIIQYLNPNDLLVLNNSKVIPARLYAKKTSGGVLAIMIERLLPNNQALAMIKASHPPKIGQLVYFDKQQQLSATILAKDDYLYTLVFSTRINKILDKYGHTPLPPYIKRTDNCTDKNRYQTVFAKKAGSIAAPTAGLHFDNNLLSQIRQAGVNIAELTLHIGIGTFLPIKSNDISQHKMHNELIEVSDQTQQKILATKQNGGRVVAVGTTVVRALESCALNGGMSKHLKKGYKPCVQESNLFIYPGFDFKVVDMLITNFHLPKSSLLVLVSAFAGYEYIKHIYQHAIKKQYRFFSYGDAMLLYKM